MKKKALLFGTSLGAALNKTPLSFMYSDPNAQKKAILSFNEYFNPDYLFTPMDLSVEAECFGSDVHFSDVDAPHVKTRLISSTSQIKNLSVPQVGEKRSRVYLDVSQRIISLKKSLPLFGGITDPFTLAGRLFGITEMFNLITDNESAAKELIEKCRQYLLNYSLSFKEVGCGGILLAEPLAGLLSPRDMNSFSSNFYSSAGRGSAVRKLSHNLSQLWCQKSAPGCDICRKSLHISLWCPDGYYCCSR